MVKQVRYGNQLAVVSSAEGIEGILIRTLNGKYAFRVYHSDSEFTDYELRHTDLCVTICDPLAALYTIGDRQVLDHDPGTLGLEKADESQEQT
jgi:hypothetical protein